MWKTARKILVVGSALAIAIVFTLHAEVLLQTVITPLPADLRGCLSAKFSNAVSAQNQNACNGADDTIAVWTQNGRLKDSKLFYSSHSYGDGLSLQNVSDSFMSSYFRLAGSTASATNPLQVNARIETTLHGQGAQFSVNARYTGSGSPLANMRYDVERGAYETGAGILRFDGNAKEWAMYAAPTSTGSGNDINPANITQMMALRRGTFAWLSPRGISSDFYINAAGAISAGSTISANGGITGSSLTVAGNSTLSPSTSTWTPLNVSGSKGGYSGFNFTDEGVRLMMDSANQGVHTDAGWLWYFQNGVLTAGTVPWSRLSYSGAPVFIANNNGRVRMADVGCWASWGSSCDANSNGVVDNADAVNGYSFNQWVTQGANVNFGNISLTSDSTISSGGNLHITSSGGAVHLGPWHGRTVEVGAGGGNAPLYVWGQIGAGSPGVDPHGIEISGNAWGSAGARPCAGCIDSIAGRPNLWLLAGGAAAAGSSGQVFLRSAFNSYNWDYAELFPSKQDLQPGDIVSVSSDDIAHVSRSNVANDTAVIGVVSENPAVLIDGSGLIIGSRIDPDMSLDHIKDEKERTALSELQQQHKGKYPIAVAGRIPVKVTTKNGKIAYGDPITSSDLPGYGMKATATGPIIGKAMSTINYDVCQAIQSESEAVWPKMQEVDDYETLTKTCYQLPDGSYLSKVMVFASTSWQTVPDDMNATLSKSKEGRFEVTGKNGIISRVAAFAKGIFARIEAGVIEAKQLIVNGIDVEKKLKEQQQQIDTQKKQIDALTERLNTLEKKQNETE